MFNKSFITLILALSLILIITGTLVAAYGFFHDSKPKKPDILQLNPVIQTEFDKLYTKYPDITQADIDTSYEILVNDCVTYQKKDNFMGDFICRGVNTGLMQNYLTQLGVSLEPSTAEYNNVGKSPQLWNSGS